jgi:uncharacterized RDD family membrane protein YckC
MALEPEEALPEHRELFRALSEAFAFDIVDRGPRNTRPSAILSASFVVADLTGNDLDVLYDLGVAHTFGKRVFLVKRDLQSTPYDLAGNRIVLLGAPPNHTRAKEALALFLDVPQVVGPVRLFIDKSVYFGENLVARRAAAFLIDVLCVTSSVALAVFFYAASQSRLALQAFLDATAVASVGALISVYVAFAYFIFATWILGASFGQRALGLRVVQSDFRPPTLGHCAGRATLAFFLNACYGLSSLASLRGPGYRAYHDILSGTLVVRKHALR